MRTRAQEITQCIFYKFSSACKYTKMYDFKKKEYICTTTDLICMIKAMNLRKIYLTVALALIMGMGAFAQDGVGIGVKGGISGNWMPGTWVDDFDTPTTNVGFYGGLFGFAELSDTMFGQIELLYTRKGVSTNNEASGKYARNISYIQLPLLLGFKMRDDSINIAVGPAFAYCIGNKVKADWFNPSSAAEVAPFNLSAIVQARYAITESFGVDLRFDFGLTRTFKPSTELAEYRGPDKGHNSSVQIGVSYMFGQ